jgi:ribulose kinase
MCSGSPPNPAELSRGAFIGLGTDADPIMLYRSILEGMACDVRMIIEGMSRFTEVPEIHTIHCFGGESRNPLLILIRLVDGSNR